MIGLREIVDMVMVVARPALRRKLSGLALVFSLLTALPSAAQLTNGELATFKASVAAASSRSPAPTAAQSDPIATDIATWIYLQNENNGADFTAYVRFTERYPDWPRRDQLTKLAEKRLTGRESDRDLLAFFSGTPPQSLRGLEAYVTALRRTDQHGQAQKAVKEFWRTGTLSVREQTELLKRYADSLDEADLHMRNDRLIIGANGAKDMTERTALASAIPLGSGHRQANAVRLHLMEQMRKGRGTLSASVIHKTDARIASIREEDQRDTGFIYDHARWLEFTDRPIEAGRVLLKHALQPHGDSSYAFKVRDMVARDLIEIGETAMAYKVASEHGVDPLDEPSTRDAEWLAGWIALRFAGLPENAWAHFNAMYKSSTSVISRARGAYWLGRTALAMGKTDIAHSWLETAAKSGGSSFYGQAAALDRYGEVTIRIPKLADVSGDERKKFNSLPLVRAARVTQQAGLTDLTKAFVLAIANTVKSQSDATLTLELAKSLGRDDLATFVAKRVGVQGFLAGEIGYPTLPRVPAQPETALIHAIIRQESTFDPRVVSPAGAMGLMQLMPATAKKQAQALGLKPSTDRLTSDPAYNVTLGSAYLQRQLDDFGGSYILAAAAYNAGPARVSQWLNRFGSPTSPRLPIKAQNNEPAYWRAMDWIEAIPFYETRNYVMRVNEAVSVYRGILAQGKPVRLALSRDLTR